MKPRFQLHVLGLLCAAIVVGSGCSDGRPARVPISGRVLIDGRPLTCGYIRFYPTGARAAGSRIDSSGYYVLSCFTPGDGAVLGKQQVSISATEPVGTTQVRWHAPKKYANPETSGLEYEVKEPSSSVDFNLTWGGGAPFVETAE